MFFTKETIVFQIETGLLAHPLFNIANTRLLRVHNIVDPEFSPSNSSFKLKQNVTSEVFLFGTKEHILSIKIWVNSRSSI